MKFKITFKPIYWEGESTVASLFKSWNGAPIENSSYDLEVKEIEVVHE